MSKDWFEDWFDSKYYHILYHLHDRKEAGQLFESFLKLYTIDNQSNILDLACGKGRFASIVSEKGYNTVGLDLSQNSIEYATQFSKENLEFYIHDMRKPFRSNYFTAIFNIFTSFGYFNNINDNIKTLKAIHQDLKDDGFLILDYFNADFIKNNLVENEIVTLENIDFHIKRWIDHEFVYKQIQIVDKDFNNTFTERVQLFDLEDFKQLFEKSGLKLKTNYGDYQFNSFDKKESKRLILIAQKDA